MIDIIRKSGLLIPKKYENEEFYWKIKEFLTRRTRKYNTPDFIVNKFYVETDSFLVVPRFFPIEDFVSCNVTKEPLRDFSFSEKQTSKAIKGRYLYLSPFAIL